ncbi:dynein intermediate chain 1, axonemal [Angomonas deanei]|nr:dynein intermediate chain 1, axonemal [Angomonas deanei]|eukprot:EPY29035.1 dynein intermediate chain 1, axonemal [Angomonas deanei]
MSGTRRASKGSALNSRKQSALPEQEAEAARETKAEEDVIIERILKAADPNVMSVPVYFDFKKEERRYKFFSSVQTVATHFETNGVTIKKDSPEAIQQEEDLQRRQKEVALAAEAEVNPALVDEGVSTKILKNQFNYSERGSQTMNQPLRECNVVTDPPPSMTFGGMATAWAIYDAYEAERIQQEKAAAAQKKAAAAQRSGKDENDALVSNANAGNIRDETAVGPKTADTVLSSADFASALKMAERMINQNDCFDIVDDFRYWEDQSDLYKEDGTLLPLWQFYTEKTKKKAVTAIALNTKYNDFFAVGYGSYDFQKPTKGVIYCFTLKNAVPTLEGATIPANPEFSFHLSSGVMCLAFHPEEQALLACGLYDGSVCVFDLRVKGDKRKKPLYQSTVRNGKHMDPVWEVYWKDSTTELSFCSVSTDGRITNWVIGKKELTSKDVMTLTVGTPSVDPEAIALNQLSGTCMDYSATHGKAIVGTEEGQVLLCTTTHNRQCLERYEGHSGAVYTARWNPFHPDVFATCSTDWTVKLWLKSSTKPLLVFDLGDCVGDIAWSPYSASVLAAVTSNGKVCIFDFHYNKAEPLCVQTVVKNAKLTHVCFSREDPIIFVGDTRGSVLSLKLSPNLRRKAVPGKGEPDDEESLRNLEKNKLTRLIDVTLKDRALLSSD